MLWPIFPTPRVIRTRRRPRSSEAGTTAGDATEQQSDELIIARAKRGDLSSFHELIDRHQTAIFNVVLRTVKDPGIAEDVTQDAFLRAWRSVGQFRGGNVRGWIMRIAVNRAYDTLRSKKRRPSESLDALDYEPIPAWTSSTQAAEDPQSFSARTELANVLERLLAHLPDDQRTALLLIDLQGFSYDEAAGIMGVAPGTIKSRVSRARSRMRDELRADARSSELFDHVLRQDREAPA